MKLKKNLSIILCLIMARQASSMEESSMNLALENILNTSIGAALSIPVIISAGLAVKTFETFQEHPIATLSIATATITFTVKKYYSKNKNQNPLDLEALRAARVKYLSNHSIIIDR